jgi:MFS family permease
MEAAARRPASITIILAARALRAFGDGFVSLILPLYLLALGGSPLEVGVVSTATLFGSAMLSLLAGSYARRIGYRRALVAASLLMAATGFAFATVHDFWPLLVVAFVGTLNPSSGDASVFMPLEHATLSDGVAADARTATFARYSLVGAIGGAAGAAFSGVPKLTGTLLGMTTVQVLQMLFVLYGVLGLVACALYRRLPVARDADDADVDHPPLTESRAVVLRLAALFSIDAFAGGLIVQSLLSLWLAQRYGFDAAQLGVLFALSGLLAAASYLAAAPLSRRIGLVNTMVFTHVPSSVMLMMLPFVADARVAIALLLARSALSQMDVPTRSSYVMAIVTPPERAAAASVTAVPRSLAAAGSPLLAGLLLQASGFGWPLVIAGGLKIAYDLTLLALFRHVRPPEEAARSSPPRARRRASARP